MKQRNHAKLLAELSEEYAQRFPESERLHRQARNSLIDGGSHNLRLIEPFPPRIRGARGARISDEDGHSILDFWQGHHANILGHNPAVVTEPLREAFAAGWGLQTGFVEQLQSETAEILCRRTGMERVRFTTSGSLATMYAILLARALTGRDRVMKIGGGWHGAQPWGLVGIEYHNDSSRLAAANHFQFSDTEGLPVAIREEVVVTRFNDTDMLSDHFKHFGGELACFILEPFVGAGGGIPADRDYLQAARDLSEKHGTILIFDEVIAGFRFHAGLLAQQYGVQPDLVTLAKIIGGGMPVAAVAGRREILKLAGRSGSVRFSGGTYSGHPACLLAARSMLAYLSENERTVYPYINDLAGRIREIVEKTFAAEGIYARCTGTGGGTLSGSSISTVVFPYEEDHLCKGPEDTLNPHICDVDLSNRVLQLALLLEDVHVIHGLGSISMAHSETDLSEIEAAYGRVARRIRASL
ncbi:MAG: aminotransferase class III-fold pyridoxal phosphate-dependent enzyme [Spirochaetaceae bacterium]|nr:MAG: aminotransferase class III-fold pyridoxal phosphate-dependent enzyme [Spirochaetaceae bacterium]